MTGFNLSEWALRHRVLVTYFMVVTLIAGAVAYIGLGREEDPAFTIKTMVVSMQWPGATTDQVLLQVTDRLEKKLQELPSLDHLRSYSKPGSSTVMVEFKESTPAGDLPALFYQVRKKISDIRHQFPSGVQGPFFNDEFGDTFGIVYAFTTDGFSYRDLKDQVELVRDRVLKVPGAGKVELIGVQDEKIYLEFSVLKLAGFGFDRQAALRSLQAQNAVTPSGVIETDDETILVRVTGQFASEQDLLAINLRANDRFLRVGDVATVRRGFSEPPQPMYRYNGVPAIGLAISMVAGGDVLSFGKAVQAAMDEMSADLPVGLEAHPVSFQPKVVEKAIGSFVKALAEAVAIVLAVSFISLGLRAGLVVALSIPLVLAATFVVMSTYDITLQRISLGALIISLGLLVDDAMITVEMMIAKLEEGLGKIEAATFAFTSTAFPMLTGTLVTVAGFLPVGFAQSSAGEYCYSLFFVVTVALLVSWVVAVVFSPLLGVWLLRETKTGVGHGHAGKRLERGFDAVVVWCLRRRYLVIVATLALFAVSMHGFGFVQQQFFPSSDRPELIIDLTLPQNASINATARMVDTLEASLKGDPDIHHWSSTIGRGAVRFYLPLDVQMENKFFAQLVVVAKDLEARERVQSRVERVLDGTAFGDVIGKVSPLFNGPPVGWPIQYRVSGEDPESVRRWAHLVAQAVAADPFVADVVFDWNEPAKVVRLRVNQDAARVLGVSSESLATAINTVVTGRSITTVYPSRDQVEVVLRAVDADRGSLETLRSLHVLLDDGRAVPLTQIADFQYDLEAPLVWRRNRLPTVTVKANFDPRVQAATVVERLAPAIDAVARQMPARYGIELGGIVEKSRKGNESLAAVAPLMLVVMVTVLMIQLQSFQRLFLVFSVAPFGLIGVVMALLPTGTPMGFVAILGCIALIGMIIRNAVILIDQIELNVAAGMNRWNAVRAATEHRLRPILLTAVAAILGMVPIAFDVFWGPMAYAVMGGLAVATVITLLFLPALYVAWFRVRDPGQLKDPVPERVEVTAA